MPMASARAKRIQAGGARQRARDPRGGDDRRRAGLECPSLSYSLLGLTTSRTKSHIRLRRSIDDDSKDFGGDPDLLRLLPPLINKRNRKKCGRCNCTQRPKM